MFFLILISFAFMPVVSMAPSAPTAAVQDFLGDEPTPEFSDMGDFSWANDSVTFLVRMGILKGYWAGDGGDGYDFPNFRPEKDMTRAEFAKVVACMFGIFEEKAAVYRLDNSYEHWHFPYVSTLISAGISQGYSEEWYGAADEIQRQDVAAIFLAAINYANMNIEASLKFVPYSDSYEIDEYARTAVETLTKMGIIFGDSTGEFHPKDLVKRAEVAVMATRVMEKVKL